ARVEDGRIDGGYRPARLAEQHHHAAGPDHLEALLERCLAHRVIDNVHAAAAGQALDLDLEVLGRVDDRLAAQSPHLVGLLSGRDRAEHARATLASELYDEAAGAPSRRMHETGLTALERERRSREVMRRRPLQHDGRRGLEADALGN